MRFRFVRWTRHPIGLIGVALTSACAILILTLFVLSAIGMDAGPYVGILAFLVLPAFFACGLLLIPLGARLQRRREQRAAESGESVSEFPVIDLNNASTRKVALAFFLLTFFNFMILAIATYKGVKVMESNEFCGTACHSVMHPEYTAYQGSPHSRVHCVECHIGPGADWFVKSKLSGTWQLVSVTFDLYPKPIPTPVHNLRPSRETCEQCHWPSKFVGDKLKIITHFGNDEAVTKSKTVLLLRVGGVQARKSHGIHWHVDPGLQIRYQADETRETIYDVELTRADGTTTLYKGAEEHDGEEEPEWRPMDCVDCHNRPTHVYGVPEREVDGALKEGRMDTTLPFIRKVAVNALNREYASHDEARAGIAAEISGYYAENYPDIAAHRKATVETAGDVVGEIFATNVFPVMNVTWDTYPDHIGHEFSPGCFRCHNDEHESEGGDLISQDCDTCHSILAWDEEEPEILDTLEAST